MKKIKKLIALVMATTMLVTMTENVMAEGEVTTSPIAASTPPWAESEEPSAATDVYDIEVNSADDIKGCQYYDGKKDDTNPGITMDNSTDMAWHVWNSNSTCFEDEKFRQAVYDAVFSIDGWYQGRTSFLNTNMRKLLYGFRGEINAKNKGITSPMGLQYLIHATEIDLSKNKISDWTKLNVSKTSSTIYTNLRYGYDVGEDPDNIAEARNVVWNIRGNPFGILPYSFGGRLDITETATTSSDYGDDTQDKFYYLRKDNQGFTGKLKIGRTKVLLESSTPSSPQYEEAKIISVQSLGEINPNYDKFVTIESHTNTEAVFKDLVTSGRDMVSVGIDETLECWTIDEEGTSTPGKHSFKYYLHPYFYVYDKMDIKIEEKGSIVFTKTDKDTQAPLSGAIYQLIKDGNVLSPIYSTITNEHGQIVLKDLEQGSYELKEVTAPQGYELATESVKFIVPPLASTTDTVTIKGGTDKFTPTGEAVEITAQNNEVFLAGRLDKATTDPVAPSKEIEFEKSGNDDVTKVLVTYDSLYDDITKLSSTAPKTIEFANLDDAAKDINTKNTSGLLRGAVHVDVIFHDQIIDAAGNPLYELTQTNTKTPKDPGNNPPTPNRPNKPNDPEEPSIPLIPLEPSEPIEPEVPVEPNTPEPPTPGVNTFDSSNLGFWVSLMIITGGVVMWVGYKKRKEHRA